MTDSKPYASLSSGLLARKGGAKPAMRPQSFGDLSGGFSGNLEDLGWNDMGPEDEYRHPNAAHLGLTPARRGQSQEAEPGPEESFEEAFEEAFDEGEGFESPAEPEPILPSVATPAEPVSPPRVVKQQQLLRERFEEADVVELPRRRATQSDMKSKAAFTLRLNPERHLKLRLASAVTRRSAQQLVTAALDDFLNSLPGLDTLAERVPAEAGKRSR